MATVTRLPPQVITTRPSYPWPGYVPGHMPGYVPGYVPSYVPGYVPSYVPGYMPSYVPGYMPGYMISYVPGCDSTFNYGNLLRPLALGHSWRPLAFWYPRPFLSFGLWPLFSRGQYLLLIMANGGLCFSAALGARDTLGLWRPPIYDGL